MGGNIWNGIYSIDPYQKYWLAPKVKNDSFRRDVDGVKLNFKNNDVFAIDLAVVAFSGVINTMKLQGVTILGIVPGHDAKATNAGTPLAIVVQKLVKGAPTRFAIGYDLLIRYKTIPKLSRGGNREIDVHLNSIQVGQPSVVKGRTVIVLDDITTTGNSLLASRQLLKNAGASNVGALAWGKTV